MAYQGGKRSLLYRIFFKEPDAKAGALRGVESLAQTSVQPPAMLGNYNEKREHMHYSDKTELLRPDQPSAQPPTAQPMTPPMPTGSYCTKCGRYNPGKNSFCTGCGNSIKQ